MFDRFPTLETARLTLREMRMEDADAVFRIFSDPVVMRYHDSETFTDVEQARGLIEQMEQRFTRSVGIRWGTTRMGDDGVIGTGGFSRWNLPDRYATIGYDLAQSAWEHGIMTEAVGAMVRFGFERLDLNRIEAETMLDNSASIRVLEKLGFQQEGIVRQKYFWKGQFHTMRLFSLLRREYAAKEDG